MPRRNANAIPIPKLSEFVSDGKATDFCWEYISTLVKVIIAKYFNKYLWHFDKDDLASLAIADAVAFILKVSSNQVDDDIKNVRNVLFTRIRNTLSNFIFRSNKLISTEDSILDINASCHKSYEISSGMLSLYDFSIDSIDSFRDTSLRTWKLFFTNGAKQKYFINDSNNSLKDWESYSEVRNMKSPCELIGLYNKYNEDQIEQLANKLDSTTGQNYFSTLYQLLGNKFLAFLDVFQEDKFTIPSTIVVKHILTDMLICEDHDNGLSDEDISTKYNKSLQSVQKIIKSKDVI